MKKNHEFLCIRPLLQKILDFSIVPTCATWGSARRWPLKQSTMSASAPTWTTGCGPWATHKKHYDDVIMTMMAAQITSLTVVYSTVYSDTNQRKHKAPRHWPLCGEFTGTGEFPAQRASYAENVSIWWRHHDTIQILDTTDLDNISCLLFRLPVLYGIRA